MEKATYTGEQGEDEEVVSWCQFGTAKNIQNPVYLQCVRLIEQECRTGARTGWVFEKDWYVTDVNSISGLLDLINDVILQNYSNILASLWEIEHHW